MPPNDPHLILADPEWYKDAIIYELHVRAFYDRDGDGIGDFRGLTEKLDYLQDLGVTAIWLLPFYPSPLKDDGYDIADYTGIHEKYGILRDFKLFLREAKQRGLRVITELVINHTSDQHPWFQRARYSPPGSIFRDYYVWSNNPEKYKETRVIFQDFESSNWTWDPVAQAYYWHRFYSHQPDLNFDNPAVKKEIFRAMDFWLKMGVDGLRLDAVPYLFEREETNCENLPETHLFLKELRRHVEAKFSNRMFLAEANQWPEDAAAYFGQGDECHMAFHFPLMPRMFMALRMEDRFPIVDILQQTPEIPDACQWALFLRNHDELTLEMVTDEERDYMYRVYSQDPQARINLGIRRRLAPLLGNHRRRIEIMNSILFAMPGTPVLYYGDEIGMGDNIFLGDRDGVRTPMQWSPDRNAGFSRANSQRLYLPVIIDPEYHYEAVNVEAQQNNPLSLLWWMKRLIAQRKHHKALSRGSIEFLYPENSKVLTFIRRYGEEIILVVNNLSRFVQYVELDLSAYRGLMPVELISRNTFPLIGELPYMVTLGPHTTYWFSLEQPPTAEIQAAPEPRQIPSLPVDGHLEDFFRFPNRSILEELLASYLTRVRWFGGKARQIKSCSVGEIIPFPYDNLAAYFIMVTVSYLEGEPDTYVLPLATALGEHAARVQKDFPQVILARLKGTDSDLIVYEPVVESEFHQALLQAIDRRRRFKGTSGELVAGPTASYRNIKRLMKPGIASAIMKGEQSNTSIVYGEWLILKILRRVEEGESLDLEIGRFLTENSTFAHNPPVAGALEYRKGRHEPITIGILNGYIPNQGDAWKYTLDVVSHFFEIALASRTEIAPEDLPDKGLLDLIKMDVPNLAQELIGTYFESARLIGERTAELHLALASNLTDPDFYPEPFTTLYQRSIYQSMRNLTARMLRLMRSRLPRLSTPVQEIARKVLERENDIFARFHTLLEGRIQAQRLRIHGDFHLGQILYTGKDFIIIDFEGEPARSLSERRLKRSPLRDVAGMLRSFHYASNHAIFSKGVRPEDISAMAKWAHFWYQWVAAMFLKSYLKTAGQAHFLPQTEEQLNILLRSLSLEKVVYEISYELNNRPNWVPIPLQGLLELLKV
jgi:maltose alpha-D-glucosyltransferase / alpha-amylase